MKASKWIKGISGLLVALGLLTANGLAAEMGRSDPESMIGAKVVGSGGYTHLGDIVGVARGGPGGPAQMYVVKVKGLWGGRGVIPLSHVVDEMTVPEKDGSTSYRVEVSVNKATFRNIATWEDDELLSSYLARLDSILGTVYGFDQTTLDGFARNLVVDYGSEEAEPESSVANL
ncbi:hypothetical protein [Pelagicoccus sp. SDUM812002]|uniref:hypothetical protein n=1 Tax=Pelagicoccus sp. SDUM812002 TaxID=3041266 RepID=UPI00280EEA00|nr:hypothetical protein [Pelagicoccus sp. SDUM812002]MDQ8185021.1 hypothetical protein [Pelagicoccus sp. SDUM812002]